MTICGLLIDCEPQVRRDEGQAGREMKLYGGRRGGKDIRKKCLNWSSIRGI